MGSRLPKHDNPFPIQAAESDNLFMHFWHADSNDVRDDKKISGI